MRPLIAEVLPALVLELQGLLRAQGHAALARTVARLQIVRPCGCGDEYCASFYTGLMPAGSERTLLLDPAEGELLLDLVRGEIRFVEVLHRPEVREALACAGLLEVQPDPDLN